MIRHRKEERRRNPGFNTISWKTEKSIDEVYNSLIDLDTVIEYTFPYQIENHDKGREAIFASESGEYQINAHAYNNEWESTEVDLIYFGNIDEEVNQIMEFYQEKI